MKRGNLSNKLIVVSLLLIISSVFVSATTHFGSVNSTTTLGANISFTSAQVFYNQTYLNFNGVDNYVNLGNSSIFNVSKPFSISIWFKAHNSSLTNQMVLFSKMKNSLYYSELTLRYNLNNLYSVVVTLGNGSGGYYLSQATSAYPSSEDTWKNFIITFNGSSYMTYKDGVFDSTMTPPAIYSSNANASLGRRGEVSADYFNGSMGDFRFYNYTLNSAQINSLYYNSSYYVSSYHYDSNIYVPIIYFHDVGNFSMVGPAGWDPINTSLFGDFISYVNSSGYTPITMTQLKNYSLGEINYSKPIVIISDDGYQGIYDYAVPILDKYNFKINLAISTVYPLNSSYSTIWGATVYNNISYMNWSTLLALQNRGYEIIGHGVNHTRYTTLWTVQERITDLNNTKNDIAGNLSKTPIAFVFPGNDWNSTIMNECNQYYLICTASDGDGYFILNNTKLNNGEFNRRQIKGAADGNTSLSEFQAILSKPNLYLTENSTPIVNLRFNENNGTTLYDSSGNGNNGTISGAKWGNSTIINTLTNGGDYTFSNGIFTLINPVYSWTPIYLSYFFNPSVSEDISASGSPTTSSINQQQLENGYEVTLQKDEQIQVQFQVNGKMENHTIKLNNIEKESVGITISSSPITFNLSVNETNKIDINGDGYYDLSIFLKNITNNNLSADLVIKTINEQIPAGQTGAVSGAESNPEKSISIFGFKINEIALFYAGGVIGIMLIIISMYFLLRKTKEKEAEEINIFDAEKKG